MKYKNPGKRKEEQIRRTGGAKRGILIKMMEILKSAKETQDLKENLQMPQGVKKPKNTFK